MKSRAVVMRRFGGPEVLVLEEVELPALRAGEIRLRALASAVNHSDLEIRAGNWTIRREPKLPYVPGLEVVGDVVAGPIFPALVAALRRVRSLRSRCRPCLTRSCRSPMRRARTIFSNAAS
jgi:NADPH:quinone reductase-like Zn-dependent oxidoreductase